MSRRETLYMHGEIVSMDTANPSPESCAVRDGVILGAGSESYCRGLLGGDVELIDLKGACLAPGFIDTHLHPVLMIYYDMNTNLHAVPTMDALVDVLREAASAKPPQMWVVGLNFDEQSFDAPRLPSRRDLDRACPHRPAIVIKHDGHSLIANTKAIEAAGVGASTPDPEGGRIDRESGGFPSGPFRESAMALILAALPLPDEASIRDAAGISFKRLASYGISSAGVILQTGEEGPAGTAGSFDSFVLQMLLDEIPVNLYCLLIADGTAALEPLRAALDRPSPKGTTRRLGGIKLYADGTYASCTAAMFEPFSDCLGTSGFMTMSGDELYRRMREAHNAGLQVAVHAIGDRANRTCVDLYARLFAEHPRSGCRHRLEHASQLDECIIADIARLGIVVSSQPMFIHSERGWLHKRLGAHRTPWTYPYRSLIDAGVRLAGASDAPVEMLDVLHALQCCVTREGFETHQCISAYEALRMFTLDAAYAQFEENMKGSISAGKRADLVVLSENPIRVAPDRIASIKVLETIVGGMTIYRA